jgi:hypothetical protein
VTTETTHSEHRVRLLWAKKQISRLLSSRALGRAVGAVTQHRVRNRGLVFDTTGWNPRAEAMLAFRLYESAEIRFIRKFFRGTQTAIELGGSLGVAGSHLLTVMRIPGSLTCVEANGRLIPLLERTLRTHATGTEIVVLHAAVADSDQVFLRVGKDDLSSRLSVSGLCTRGLSLAAIVASTGYIDYHLLSDIEGAEASFIFGGAGLERCSRMVIELHDTIYRGQPITTDDMLRELERQRFRLLDRYGNVCALAR